MIIQEILDRKNYTQFLFFTGYKIWHLFIFFGQYNRKCSKRLQIFHKF